MVLALGKARTGTESQRHTRASIGKQPSSSSSKSVMASTRIVFPVQMNHLVISKIRPRTADHRTQKYVAHTQAGRWTAKLLT